MAQSKNDAGVLSVEMAGAIGVAFGLVAGSILARLGNSSSSTAVAASTTAKKQLSKTTTTTTTSSLSSRPPYTVGQKPTFPSSTFGKNVEVFDPEKLKSSYSLMISTATPRPIALVSSTSKSTRVDNVSPFSYFGLVAHDPPTIAVGFCRKGPNKDKKDSLCNILENKEFAVNIMSNWYIDAANHACGNFNPDVDEFVESGMTKAKCTVVNAPRVKEAAVTYECKLDYVHPLVNKEGKPTTEIVLAQVIRVHVDREVLVDNYDPLKPNIDTTKLMPLGRLGGNLYCTLGDIIDIPRPQV